MSETQATHDDGSTCDLCGAEYDERLEPCPENARVSTDGVTKCYAETGVFVHDSTEPDPLADPDEETTTVSFTTTVAP